MDPDPFLSWLDGFVARGTERARHLEPDTPDPWGPVRPPQAPRHAPPADPDPAAPNVARTALVHQWLRNNPGYHTQSEVAGAVGHPRTSVARSLRWLADRGEADFRSGRGWYTIPAKGAAA